MCLTRGRLNTVSQFAPAKLNLFLAVTGRRTDGFHDVVSVAAPLDWGDRLEAELAAATTLQSDELELPLGESNLVLKAAAAFRAATGWEKGVAFRLTKRIPMGAGLGGGSSDAVAALLAMNKLAGNPLCRADLLALAARLGADCALFLGGEPVIMRGKGEQLERMEASVTARLRGRRVFIFKPGFGVSTPWAYGRMIARPETYLPTTDAEARLKQWRESDAPVENLLYNNMETVVFAKYPALPALYDTLRERFGLAARMSGSGSASFAFLPEGADLPGIESCVREAWGPTVFTITAQVA